MDYYSNLRSSIYAVIVGIDDYPSQPLIGAVNDARNVQAFVENELIIPEGKLKSIKLLTNGDATKKNIIKFLRDLYAPDSPVQQDDLVIIYFAGHGARGDPPEGWNPRGQSEDKTIEMICPVDIGQKADGKIITGIPDVVLGSIITRISERSGNIVSLPFSSSSHSQN